MDIRAFSRGGWSLCLATLIASLSTSHAASLSQMDSFQGGTTAGWGSGLSNPHPPALLPDAGPLGAGDTALLITAGGNFNAGSRLVTFNAGTWTGDYLGAGIDGIVLDVENPNDFTLHLRLALSGPGGAFASTESVDIAPDTGWQHVFLPIEPGALSSVGGSDVNATLGAVSQLRLLHNDVPMLQGMAIAGSMHVDNISAVPEPSILLLGFLGLVCCYFWSRSVARSAAAPGKGTCRGDIR